MNREIEEFSHIDVGDLVTYSPNVSGAAKIKLKLSEPLVHGLVIRKFSSVFRGGDAICTVLWNQGSTFDEMQSNLVKVNS